MKFENIETQYNQQDVLTITELKPPELELITTRQQLATYRDSDPVRSSLQLFFTMTGFVSLLLISLLSYEHAVVLSMLSATLTALCLLRLFMIQHDCGHGSYFKSVNLNHWVGRLIGVISFTPYQCWRKFHATHHASNGNLDKRGLGDIQTLTVNEYAALSPWKKLYYRIYRNPVVLFVIGPIYLFFVRQRFTHYIPKEWQQERRSVYLTNISMAVFITMMGLSFGFETFLVVYTVVMALASMVGVWLFFIQHQFEDTYWEEGDNWDYSKAAVQGSSYYDLPSFVQWMIAHINVHHVHHLDCKIPNYNLKACNEAVAGLKESATHISFLQSLQCIKYKLWDESNKRMVTF